MAEELKELLGKDGSRVYKEVEKTLQGGNARAKSAARSVQRFSPLTPRHGQSAYHARQGSLSRHSTGRAYP